MNVDGTFRATSILFLPIAVNTVATTSCTWTSPSCNTAESIGDWAVVIELTLNVTPITTTSYTISVIGFSGGLTGQQIPFTITIPISGLPTQLFEFDLGLSMIPGTVSMLIIVQ